MDETLKLLIIYLGIPTILGIGAWIMRSTINRISELEHQIRTKVEEDKVRVILNDKLDPIREDVHEIKVQINRLMDLILKK